MIWPTASRACPGYAALANCGLQGLFCFHNIQAMPKIAKTDKRRKSYAFSHYTFSFSSIPRPKPAPEKQGKQLENASPLEASPVILSLRSCDSTSCVKSMCKGSASFHGPLGPPLQRQAIATSIVQLAATPTGDVIQIFVAFQAAALYSFARTTGCTTRAITPT